MSANDLYNERELLQRIAEGDESAFKLLHHRYWNEIYSLALAFVKSPEWAEDVLQEVFIKLWLKKETLPGIERFEPFLFVMVRNELISALRKYKKRERDVADYIHAGVSTEVKENTVELSETGRLVQDALKELTPQQQLIFKLSREDGLNHDMIAQQLELSKKTVSNTITIVLSHIRTYLYKKGNLIISILWVLTTRFES